MPAAKCWPKQGMAQTSAGCHKEMWNRIEKILSSFQDLFSRGRAYNWFVTIIIGMMVRTDKLGGITAIIRSLCLKPDSYEKMLKFFRASSWSLPRIQCRWQQVVAQRTRLFQLNDRSILVGDGVKQSKEGCHMPGVKRMVQESETQTKPEIIHGHMWGCVGVLLGDAERLACVPVSMHIHDGLQTMHKWTAPEQTEPSHVVKMIQNTCQAAQQFGHAYCLMDRYFLTVPALQELHRQNAENLYKVDLITKAKCSAVAYEFPPTRQPGQRGRPRKKGARVKLFDLFQERAAQFQTEKINMYGKEQMVSYYCIDLLWGQKWYQELRFVLVVYNGKQSILVSTDLTLHPLEIILAYCYRFRIETTFRSFKQEIGGMAYRFWSKHMPTLSHFQKKEDPGPLEQIQSEQSKDMVRKTVRATEMYVLLSCIAMGIIQMLSVDPAFEISKSELRYQRTPAKAAPSEGNIMYYLRNHIFPFMAAAPHQKLTQIIRSHLSIPSDVKTSKAA